MKEPLKILLVEDDLVDIKSVRRALREKGSSNVIDVVPHGEAALEYLRGNGHPGRRPSLILLDISMPKMDGFEFLQTLKSDEALRTIPVIVLTTSRNSADV